DAGGGLLLDPARHVATLDGERVMLTSAEFDLLRALATRPGVAWEREELVREVWHCEFIESDFLVDVHVANLRRKLRRAGSRTTWIRTIGGASYLYDPS
ncbi:MAG: winged helix-turn-helix domain-containing protein, partial [Nocardioides sp.]